MNPRARQETPADLVADLLQAIRAAFYQDSEPQRWFQDQSFLKRRVVLWPAGWLSSRGVSLKPERYKSLLLEIISEARDHQTAQIKYAPAYLAKCVQSHFAVHGDEIYAEGKSLRTLAEHAILACKTAATAAQAPDPIASLATAAHLLKSPRRSAKPRPVKQLSLGL
jgi:hypothetical protein